MKKIFILATALGIAGANAWADVNCQGIVVDENGEPMIGVVVLAEGQSMGVPTDIDGKFQIVVPDGSKNLTFNYVGYQPLTLPVASAMGNVTMTPEANMLQDVIVTQSVARTRMTPVALSNVDAAMIETKLGAQEFPEVLKTTPGVWATKDGGGYGDAKINMRGFKSPNTAMLVNGIPVNDMEWGGVYWSNWTGLSDVTTSMQTQRGLGASILSAPSVGGTISLVTRSLDAEQGGTVWYGMGSGGMNQFGASVSTGVMKNGWAVTLLGSHRWANDGYIQGTGYSAYTYFLNVSKRINDDHQISFTATGSPQWHDQRGSYDGLSVEGWQNVRNYMDGESPYRYNPTFGYDNTGQQRAANHNFYHKPHLSLTHIWQINYHSSLTTSAYASIASGGGYRGEGRNGYGNSSWYGASNGTLSTMWRRPDGTFDYGAIQDMNAASTTGSNMVMTSSLNNHEWFGLVSNYKNRFNDKFTFTGGIDVRYYVGHHKNRIEDLYDGEYYMDDNYRGNVKASNNIAAADPNWKYQKLGVGDIVYRNYNGYTMQEGIYLQGEYTGLDKKLTAIITGTVNNTAYWRRDFFYYDKAHEKSETVNFWAGSIKGGVNYNIDRHMNVYFNTGYITRAPFYSGGAFLNSTTSNATNPNAVNEKTYSFELGWAWHSPIFTFTVDSYYTKWLDKTTTRTGDFTSGDKAGQRYSINMQGVNARHMGLEFNAAFEPVNWFSMNGMLSIGDWQWDSNATGYFYDEAGQPLANVTTGAVASGIEAEDHLKATINQKGVKVGGSAQWTGAVGITFRPFKGMRIGADWTASSHLYSDYTVSTPSAGGTVNVADPWRIPWGNELDLNASYRFKMGGFNATLIGNVNNLFNYNYIVDAYTSSSTTGTWENAYRIFYNFGRTYTIRLKVAF